MWACDGVLDTKLGFVRCCCGPLHLGTAAGLAVVQEHSEGLEDVAVGGWSVPAAAQGTAMSPLQRMQTTDGSVADRAACFQACIAATSAAAAAVANLWLQQQRVLSPGPGTRGAVLMGVTIGTMGQCHHGGGSVVVGTRHLVPTPSRGCGGRPTWQQGCGTQVLVQR